MIIDIGSTYKLSIYDNYFGICLVEDRTTINFKPRFIVKMLEKPLRDLGQHQKGFKDWTKEKFLAFSDELHQISELESLVALLKDVKKGDDNVL